MMITDAAILTVDVQNTVLDAAWGAVRDGRISGTGPAQTTRRAGLFNEDALRAKAAISVEPVRGIVAAAPAAFVDFSVTARLRCGPGGICPAIDLRPAGVTAARSTDNVAANTGYNLIAEMCVAGPAVSHRNGRARPLLSLDLVQLSTIGGACDLGLDGAIGSIDPGETLMSDRQLGYRPLSANRAVSARSAQTSAAA